MEMKQIELELAYVGYVKITDGVHVIKLCKETCLSGTEVCSHNSMHVSRRFKSKLEAAQALRTKKHLI